MDVGTLFHFDGKSDADAPIVFLLTGDEDGASSATLTPRRASRRRLRGIRAATFRTRSCGSPRGLRGYWEASHGTTHADPPARDRLLQRNYDLRRKQ